MKDLLEKLQKLGLSGREAEIYLALLSKKELTAPEIGKITSVTRTKSYEILQNLIKKGLCNVRYKNGKKVYCSIEPSIALQNLLSVYEKELSEKKKLVERFQDDLVALHKKKEVINDPLDYIEVLSDINQIKDRWLNIQKNTKKEILVFSKPPYAQPLEDNIEVEAEGLKMNKIVVKGLYEYYGLTSEERDNLIKLIETYQKLGEETKIIKELPMKLIISDDKITMFALKDRVSLKPSITTMIVDHPSFATALKNVFESYWAKAISLEDFKRNLL